jgi:hypothetical protein
MVQWVVPLQLLLPKQKDKKIPTKLCLVGILGSAFFNLLFIVSQVLPKVYLVQQRDHSDT